MHSTPLLSVDLFNFDSVTDADGFTSFGGLKGRSQPKQDPPIERDLALTLEEVFNGCIKKMKISRKVSHYEIVADHSSLLARKPPFLYRSACS